MLFPSLLTPIYENFYPQNLYRYSGYQTARMHAPFYYILRCCPSLLTPIRTFTLKLPQNHYRYSGYQTVRMHACTLLLHFDLKCLRLLQLSHVLLQAGNSILSFAVAFMFIAAKFAVELQSIPTLVRALVIIGKFLPVVSFSLGLFDSFFTCAERSQCLKQHCF